MKYNDKKVRNPRRRFYDEDLDGPGGTIDGEGVFDMDQGLPSDSKRVYDRYRLDEIKAIQLRREPVARAIEGALHLVSLGKWFSAKDGANIDKFFHLSSVWTMADGTRLMVEKNEVINISHHVKDPSPETEFEQLNVKDGIYMEKVFEGMERELGKDRLFVYDAFSANCQDFMLAVANHAGHPSMVQIRWIKQPVDVLMSGLPSFVQPFAKILTNVGNKVQQLIQTPWLKNLADHLHPVQAKAESISHKVDTNVGRTLDDEERIQTNEAARLDTLENKPPEGAGMKRKKIQKRTIQRKKNKRPMYK